MLSTSENELLTRVGPGTPMGKMMRRFWLPICTSAQLPEPDGDPLRLHLLGETFVLFRDTAGKVGLLDELCMHRGVSLALGRVEDCGIRCLYHGWKFSVDGTILDTPNNGNPRFKQGMKAPAHPIHEAGGLVWTYIGPKGDQSDFPHFEFMNGPPEHRAVIRINTPANYLQLYEGGTDSSHVGILHSNQANPTWMSDEFTARDDEDFNPGALASSDNAPTLEVEDTPFGYHYVAKRQGPAGEDGSPTASVRVTPVFLPVGRIIPAPAYQFFVFEVPQHDHVTSTYIVAHGDRPVDRAEIIRIMGLREPFWNDRDCDFRADWSNRMGQDRARMATNWTGFDGIEQEDAVLAVSMGSVVDRTREHLVPADRAVIHLRARLRESVRRHENGELPIGLEIVDYTPVRSLPDTVIGTTDRWQELVPGNTAVSV